MTDALVFDVGGTNLRAGRYSFPHRQLVGSQKKETPNIWNTPSHVIPLEELMKGMIELGNKLFPEEPPTIVTIGFPGPITPTGEILSTPTIWGDKSCSSIPLTAHFAGLWPNSKVHVINDVSAAGYYLKDVYPDDFCVITISSGIGSKLFMDGKPYTGVKGRGGEIGHWVTDETDQAMMCECGGKGHLSGIASGRGVLAYAKMQAKLCPSFFRNSSVAKITNSNYSKITNEILVAGYKKGDQWCESIINRTAKELAKVIAMIHTTTGIELFIIIGGFSIALGEPYRRCLVEFAKEFCWNLGQDWDMMIKIGPEETEMGLLGAGIFSENIRVSIYESS